MKTKERFYIDKPGGSYGTKPKKWWRLFKRKPRVLRTTRRIDGNGNSYTEYVLTSSIPGHPTMTLGLSAPKFKKSGMVRNKRLL